MAKSKGSSRSRPSPKGNSRSAISGRYVTKAHATRSPRTTVTEKAQKRK